MLLKTLLYLNSKGVNLNIFKYALYIVCILIPFIVLLCFITDISDVFDQIKSFYF